ncbi:MAG: NAD-dependent epimerase/dehydratase family protein [Planctomycetota bacterium]|nr:NAD-dependent epimerase/dehydratase family protein [Planctomycetota bacterium]
MATFLVTGGAGFIGSHIAEALVRRGDQVRILDDLCTGFRVNFAPFANDVEFMEGDISDPAIVAKAVRGVECIFHEAALASVPLSVERPLDSNRDCVTGTLNILDQAQRAGVRRVIYAGSSAVYGDRPSPSKHESDMPMILSPYAAAKLAGELYCQAFYHTHGLETVCLRYFNVFGPRQDPNSAYSAVIPLFITKLLKGESPVVFGDGLQSRDFTFVENVVHGNLLAAEAVDAPGKTFNLADGRSTTLLQLLSLLEELLEVEVKPIHEAPRVGDVRESLADITAARTILGYEPRITFDEGLRRSIDYYRSVIVV